jgi:hypothetical protein
MRFRSLAILLLLSLAPALRAQEVWLGTSDVTFKGYSTLHDFTGTAKAVPLKVVVSPGKNGRVVSATSDVEVKRLNTSNEKRDSNMMLMFQEAQHHLIKVEVTDAEERTLKGERGRAGRMPVTLTIAGKHGTVNGTVVNISESPKSVSFDLTFSVSLKAFNLDPPSTLGGLVKVQDNVDVTAHVTLRKGGAR